MLRLVVDSIADGIVVADRDGSFVLWNPAATRLAPPGHSDAPPERWPEVYHLYRPDGVTLFPSDRLPLVRAIEGESVDAELMIAEDQATGQRRTLSVTGRPIVESDGEIVGGVVVFRDVTDHLRMEREIRRSNSTLHEFAATVSHDLKSPLSTIMGFADVLQSEHGHLLPDEGQASVREIRDAALRMRDQINALLAQSQIGEGWATPGPVVLTGVLERVLRDLHGVIAQRQAQVGVLSRLPTVIGHELGLRQALQNLIENAIKFTPPDRAPLIEVGCDEHKGWWHFWVRDQGIGIDPVQVDRVFDMFTRLHPSGFEGSGVGLARVRKIAELHHGVVRVESRPGHGSTFTLSLPKDPGG